MHSPLVQDIIELALAGLTLVSYLLHRSSNANRRALGDRVDSLEATIKTVNGGK